MKELAPIALTGSIITKLRSLCKRARFVQYYLLLWQDIASNETNAQSSLLGMEIFTLVLRTVCARFLSKSLRICHDGADCMLYMSCSLQGGAVRVF